MTTALEITPEVHPISSGVRNADKVAGALTHVLADTYRLMFKTHAYHWNVEGPLFFSLHKLTEDQYQDLFAAADDLAERIRAVGQMAPMAMKQIVEASAIADLDHTPTAGEMCADLAADHEKIAKRLKAVIEVAGKHNDPVTEDLATARSAFHEQAAWMLKAIANG